jgi:hypothetical protein
MDFINYLGWFDWVGGHPPPHDDQGRGSPWRALGGSKIPKTQKHFHPPPLHRKIPLSPKPIPKNPKTKKPIPKITTNPPSPAAFTLRVIPVFALARVYEDLHKPPFPFTQARYKPTLSLPLSPNQPKHPKPIPSPPPNPQHPQKPELLSE